MLIGVSACIPSYATWSTGIIVVSID